MSELTEVKAKDELNPIYHLLALLGAHHIFHVSGLRVNFNFSYKVFLKLVGNYVILKHY